MRYSYLAVAVLLAWAAATFVAMLYGVKTVIPDFVHVDYGFPMKYATHTLIAINGPVDNWGFDMGSLVADLAIWVSGIAVIAMAGMYLGFRQSRR
ncbi:MAG: hypothetical protein KGI26_06300 [Thaumarchaeota archaeon]|nr:hypothetical protein [Nitrososphaerota archaeon]